MEKYFINLAGDIRLFFGSAGGSGEAAFSFSLIFTRFLKHYLQKYKVFRNFYFS